MITPDRLRELFNYVDGKLYWKISPSCKMRIGSRAGSLSNGYWKIRVNGEDVYEHRAVFAMFHGYYPDQIDHINRDKLYNRIENLRESDHRLNGNNRGATRVSKTGVKGVFISGKRIIDGKFDYRGTFSTLEEATKVANRM